MNRKILAVVAAAVIAFGGVISQASERVVEHHTLKLAGMANAPIRVVSQRVRGGAHWLDSLALEVENTSRKPIYFISIHITIEGTEARYGAPLLITLTWGDPRLAWVDHTASSSDRSLAPGARTWMHIPREHVAAFYADAEKTNSVLPTSAEVLPYMIGFGDGVSWLVGRRVTREENAAVLAAATQKPEGTNSTRTDCGTAGTDGVPSCICSSEPRWFLAPQGNYEKLVERTCYIVLPDLSLEPCIYKVVRPC